MKKINIKVQEGNGDIRECELTYARDNQSYNIQLEYTFELIIEGSGSDYFDALIQIREQLSDRDALVLCNGARGDVYPSRMMRQMAGGIRASVFHKGQQARREDIVGIFDYAPVELIVSPSEQKQNYKNWIASLGQGNP